MKDILSTFSEVVMRTICEVRSICKAQGKDGKKKKQTPATTIIRYRELNIYSYIRK